MLPYSPNQMHPQLLRVKSQHVAVMPNLNVSRAGYFCVCHFDPFDLKRLIGACDAGHLVTTGRLQPSPAGLSFELLLRFRAPHGLAALVRRVFTVAFLDPSCQS